MEICRHGSCRAQLAKILLIIRSRGGVDALCKTAVGITVSGPNIALTNNTSVAMQHTTGEVSLFLPTVLYDPSDCDGTNAPDFLRFVCWLRKDSVSQHRLSR